MFSKRIILILIVLFVLCFSLTCVSATQDNTTTNEQSVDENMDFNSDNVISSDLDDNRKEVDVYSYDIPKEKIARNGEISIKVWDYKRSNLTTTHYNENITGNISIQINDIEVYNRGIEGYSDYGNSKWGGNSFNVPNSYLNIGDNTVKIIYAGDDNYKPFTYAGIMKYNQFIGKMDDEIEFKGYYRFNVADDATGIVNIEIDDEPYLSINATELRNKYFNFEDLSLGKHNYKITYFDDEKYKLDNAIEGEFNLTTRVFVYPKYYIPTEKIGDEGTIYVKIIGYDWYEYTRYKNITGNIFIYINDKKAYNEEIKLVDVYYEPYHEYGGNFFKIPNSLLNLGYNDVKIVYDGDENFKPFSYEGKVYYNTFLDVKVDKEVRLYYDYIDFNIADDATGIVKIEIDNKTYVTINAVELRKKSNKIYFDDLSFGKHTYKITYSDDEKYKFEDSFEGEFNLTYNFKVTLYKNKNGMADVNIILPFDAKNEVLISYNGKNISVLPKAKHSTYYDYDYDNIDITLDDLKNGKNEISFTYMDDKYPKKTIVKHFYVNPFTVPENPSFNDVISIYLPDAKGNFLVYEQGDYNYETHGYDITLLANTSLKDGKANFSLSNLKLSNLRIGSHNLYLGYEGADVDAFFDAKDTFNYNSITISPFIVPENPSFNDVISIYLPDAKGNFLVYEQGDYNYETHGYDKTLLANTSLKDGKANFSLSKLKIGYQNLLIAYEGDDINNYLKYETSSNIYECNEYIRINPIVEYPHFMVAGDDTNYIKVTLPENNENIINITIRSYEDNITEVYNGVINGTVDIPIPKLESGGYSIRINYGDDSWDYDVYVFYQKSGYNWIDLICDDCDFYYEFYVDDSLCDSGKFYHTLELYLNEILSDVVYGNHSWELKVIDKYYNKTIATGNFSINWLDFPDTINREYWVSLNNLNEKEGYYTLFIDDKFYDADFLDYSIKISNLTAGFHTYEVTCWDENNIKKLSQNGLFNFTLNYDEIDEPENPDYPEPVDDDSERVNKIIIEKENNEIKSIQYILYNNPYPEYATNLVVCPIRYVETYYKDDWDYSESYYYSWEFYGDPIQNVTIVDGHANITLKDFKPGTYDLGFSFEGNDNWGYVNEDIHFKISPKIIPKNIILPKELSSDGTFEVTLELPENSKGTISIWEYGNESPVSFYPDEFLDDLDWRLNQLIKTNYSSDNKTIIIPNIGRYFEENSTVCLLLEYDDEKYGKYVTNFTLTTPAVISDDVGGKIIVSKNTSSNTLDISLPNNKSGDILVISGNKTIYSNVKNGTAKIDLSNISEGYYDIYAKYSDEDFENFEHVNLTISKSDFTVENNNYTNNTNTSNQSNDSSKEKTKVKPKIIAKKKTFSKSKVKPKIIAKKKTFSKSKKVKRYVISLKVGKKPVKKVKLYLKMGKKTFKAKTNNKGKATFKIKLNKKGTYKSIIKFNGNKLYHAVSKKVTIKIK